MEQVTTSQGTITRLVADSGYVGWSDGPDPSNQYHVNSCTGASCSSPAKFGYTSTGPLVAANSIAYWEAGMELYDSPLASSLPPPAFHSGTSVTQLTVAPSGTVYWSAGGDVESCSPGSCSTPTPIILSGVTFLLADPTTTATESDNLYFVIGSTIRLCPVSGPGCATAPSFNWVSVSGTVTGMAIDATNVYWTDMNGLNLASKTTGGQAKLLLAGASGDVVVDATNLFVISKGGISSCSSMVCSSTPFISPQSDTVTHLAVDGGFLYFATKSGSILRVQE